MKADTQDRLISAPQPRREILDQIRNDRELIERLRISPRELEALSKCALLGTLTCKADMLFILRQIREASGPATDQVTLVPQPAPLENKQEDHGPDVRRIPVRIAPVIPPEPGSLETIVRRRVPEQLGVLFWVLVLVAGLVWNGAIVMSRSRDNFAAIIGSVAGQASPSDAWYGNLDQFNVLLSWEILFVAGVTLVIYLKSRRGSRRLKVRPGQRSRWAVHLRSRP